MAHVSTDEVLSALRTVDFPASKEELIQAAREAGAFDEVICARRAIPPVEYANRNEVARSVPVDPTEDLGLSPGQQGQQARQRRRHHGPQRLSQYLRDVPRPTIEEGQDE
jgi:hypothetical protein